MQRERRAIALCGIARTGHYARSPRAGTPLFCAGAIIA
jgi:hypothetical protein